MDKVIINLVDEQQDGKESELVELGEVSKETKGHIWGTSDGGGGRCFC